MTYTLISPIRVPISENKQLALNLNIYRNAHFQSLNKAKKQYKVIMQPQIDALPVLNIIKIEYKLYIGTKRSLDIVNVCAIIDKFFADALTESGKIKDDNYNYYTQCVMTFGGYEKNNERVEITITEIT